LLRDQPPAANKGRFLLPKSIAAKKRNWLPALGYDDIDRALAAYNAVRQPLSERIVSHARKLGMQLGVGIETDDDRRFAKLLQSPKGILDWIAVPNFLDMRPSFGGRFNGFTHFPPESVRVRNRPHPGQGSVRSAATPF
jgi:hypothetical protein